MDLGLKDSLKLNYFLVVDFEKLVQFLLCFNKDEGYKCSWL